MEIKRFSAVNLQVSNEESDAVKIAVTSLRRDLIRVLDCDVNSKYANESTTIVIGTLGISKEIEEKADIACFYDEENKKRKEAFLLQVKNGELLIAGSDRRGTIYGIYELCAMLGVSPWYFFADVPVQKRDRFSLEENWFKSDYPSVEYRGIFINDEEELEHWVWKYMGEETIGVKTYEKIFELLLRLKLNYIWPAMHVNSFNMKQENGALANRMGIVVGTSHCDMLMRSNNREWYPWLAKKGYTDVEYDYSLPGRNRDILNEYWRESVEQNKDFEVSYTLGMRGIHDSGFETRMLEGKSGKELLDAKIELLTTVVNAQQDILAETLDEKPMKLFVPYKEVLELYDNGLQVPEDLTLIWVNDNYGYIRRYPNEKEKQRAGGNGIYYHNSYWAPPGASYLFLNSIPLSHTRNELKKAWEQGIRKLWVTNFGAIKPLEEQLSFYAQLAWEAGKENAITDNETAFLEKWLDDTFSIKFGKALAPMLVSFDQLTNVRKVEHMDCDIFSLTAYGDEGAARLHQYEEMFETANRMYEMLPEEEKDAFFQLVLMRIQATYYTNAMYYYADRSNLCMEQQKSSAADLYTKKSLAFDHARRNLLYYYNRVMSNGKWDGILTPEDFPPPRTAMYPACMPTLREAERKLILSVWNEEEKIHFTVPAVKWIELANAGTGSILCEIELPKWLNAAEDGLQQKDTKENRHIYILEVKEECRILLSVCESELKKLPADSTKIDEKYLSSTILVRSKETKESYEIPVSCDLSSPAWNKSQSKDDNDFVSVEDDGRICIEADDTKNYVGWKLITGLGRSKGSLLQADVKDATAEYSFYCSSEGNFELELHRFPSLNSVGRIRIGVSVDKGELLILESESNDEHRGSWNYNIRNNVDKLFIKLPWISAGKHELRFHAIDRYTAFSRFVIYTKERKENNLGYADDRQKLPKDIDIEAFAKQFYKTDKMLSRPLLYLQDKVSYDTTTMEDIVKLAKPQKSVSPQDILKQADEIFVLNEKIRIDAASALAETKNAYTKGDWQYCNSPSHSETGLAMYRRKASEPIKDPKLAPSLHYRIKSEEDASYRIWAYIQFWEIENSHLSIGIDEKIIPEEKLYQGQRIWRYSSEHVWKWVPLYETELEKGEHELTIYAQSAHLRIDAIYISKGKELPE